MKNVLSCLLLILSVTASAQERSVYTQSVSPKGSFIAISKDKLVYVYELVSDVAKLNVTMGADIAGSGFSKDDQLFIVMDYNYTFRAFDLSKEGEEVWTSDILEFIERPPERMKVRILESESGDYILAQHLGQSIVLDRYSGELVGYANLDIDMYQQRDEQPVSVWSTGPNAFEVMNYGSKGFYLGSLDIEGYGSVDSGKRYVDSEAWFPMLAHYPGKTLFYEEVKGKYEVKLNGKSFRKASERMDVPYGQFSQDGKFFATGKSEKATLYEYSTGKKIQQFDTREVPFFLNTKYAVTGAYKASYKVFDVNTGQLLKSVDREEDLKYKGTSIVKSPRTRAAGVIFFDDFDDNFNEWSVGEQKNGNQKIVNGQYELVSYEKNLRTWNSKIGIDHFRDFELEVRLKCENDDDNSQFGIFWGRSKDYSYRDVIRIKNKGAFYIGKYRRGKWYAGQSWKDSDIVSTDFNTLRVTKVGGIVTYFLNDQEVLQEPFTGLMGRKVGFDYNKGKLIVDFVKVSYLSEESQSEIFIYGDEFDNDSDKWLAKRKEGSYDQRIVDGHFRYEVMAEKTSYTKWNNRFYIDKDKDYIFETSVRFESTTSSALLGLAWGRATKGGKQYRFGFSPKGSMRVDYYDGKSYQAVSDWKKVGIKPYEFTRLKIKKIGEVYKFYVNDKLVAIEKGIKGFGPIEGFVIPERTIAHVDYIRAKYINATSREYRTYSSRTGNRIYIPYMRPNNPANLGGKVLIGEALYCSKIPKREGGGMGLATTTQKIKWDYWIVEEEDEVEFGKSQLREIYGPDWLIWNHTLKCK